MGPDPVERREMVFSYLTLRKTIGILGMALPFVVYLGALIFFDTGMQKSISGYYHTGMRDVFVGTLCVIGFFLLSYRGYDRLDDMAGDLACVFAVGVALFPTAPGHAASRGACIVGFVHLAFAALFFMTLICFSLFLFTRTDANRQPSRKKLQRNRVYRACGYAMSVCILLIVVCPLLPDEVAVRVRAYEPVFWLEAVAIVSFGISWLTKGQAILGDDT